MDSIVIMKKFSYLILKNVQMLQCNTRKANAYVRKKNLDRKMFVLQSIYLYLLLNREWEVECIIRVILVL